MSQRTGYLLLLLNLCTVALFLTAGLFPGGQVPIHSHLDSNNGGTLVAGQGFAVGSNAIILWNGTGGCPTGFTEVTAARGFYPRGMLAAGETIATTTGTALTANENRPVGQHNHTTTPLLSDGTAGGVTNQTITSSAANTLTNVTVNNAGAVAGTNAPYYLVQFCAKT
jgi:hypothetical protein